MTPAELFSAAPPGSASPSTPVEVFNQQLAGKILAELYTLRFDLSVLDYAKVKDLPSFTSLVQKGLLEAYSKIMPYVPTASELPMEGGTSQ